MQLLNFSPKKVLGFKCISSKLLGIEYLDQARSLFHVMEEDMHITNCIS